MPNSSEITLDSIVTHGDDQVGTELDNEVVLMSIEQGNYYGFDKILSKIWNMIEQPIKVSDLCERLLKEYEVDRETCERDVLKALNDLNNEGLLSIQ